MLCLAGANLEERGDNDVEKRQASSLGSKQEVGVNEESVENTQRLKSFAFGAWPQWTSPSRQLQRLIVLIEIRQKMNC
jgi:hypothetical protein